MPRFFMVHCVYTRVCTWYTCAHVIGWVLTEP